MYGLLKNAILFFWLANIYVEFNDSHKYTQEIFMST